MQTQRVCVRWWWRGLGCRVSLSVDQPCVARPPRVPGDELERVLLELVAAVEVLHRLYDGAADGRIGGAAGNPWVRQRLLDGVALVRVLLQQARHQLARRRRRRRPLRAVHLHRLRLDGVVHGSFFLRLCQRASRHEGHSHGRRRAEANSRRTWNPNGTVPDKSKYRTTPKLHTSTDLV